MCNNPRIYAISRAALAGGKDHVITKLYALGLAEHYEDCPPGVYGSRRKFGM